MSKRCVLRFDVDTELCLREGVEPLCEVAERYGVPLTFFVNPGRAIDRGLLLREALPGRSRGEEEGRAARFGSVTKLGRAETLHLLLTNPRSLPARSGMVRRILDGGHEVGLHGGHNHATWQRNARRWSRGRVAAEVAWGKFRLETAAGRAVTSFASLGWTSPDALAEIQDLTSGFRVVRADKFREFLYLLPNGFSYPTTTTMAFFRAGYGVAYEPIVAAKRIGKSHIRLVRDGVRFLLIIFKIGTLYSPLKLFFPFAFLHLMLVIGHYDYTFTADHRLSVASVFLWMAAVTIFLIGLVSEQITQLMYKDTQATSTENRSQSS